MHENNRIARFQHNSARVDEVEGSKANWASGAIEYAVPVPSDLTLARDPRCLHLPLHRWLARSVHKPELGVVRVTAKRARHPQRGRRGPTGTVT